MVVYILENAPEKLRGILTRWMIEVRPGIFVGSLNAMVRDKIWEQISNYDTKGALMVYLYNNEQGYQIKMLGDPTRQIIDLDGLQLIKRKQ